MKKEQVQLDGVEAVKLVLPAGEDLECCVRDKTGGWIAACCEAAELLWGRSPAIP